MINFSIQISPYSEIIKLFKWIVLFCLLSVVESLSAISEVASHLDIKVSVALWKVISR